MSSNAPGQFLGYSIQIPRALFHLLKAGPGDIVCVEVLGDISTVQADGHLNSEEDKSSMNSNPLTNKSTDLWKTFYNWIIAINNKEIDVHKTTFILYSNKAGNPGIVNEFHAAASKKEADSAIAVAKDKLKDIDKNHDIWKYYNVVVNQNESLLVEVIQKFELQIGIGAGYDEVQTELVRKHLPANQIQFLLESIVGWLHKELTEMIAAKQSARIRWEDFDKHVTVLFDRVRRMELIDFTLKDPIEKNQIEQQVKIHPCYLKQLDAIDCDVDDKIEAVCDFLRAKVNRDKWIENEIIDEDNASDFQENLISFWRNQKKRIKLTQEKLSTTEQGKLLLLDCKDRQETIRDMRPPSSTIAGTYHALADEPLLGWHPNWEMLFKKGKDE
jgi:hypothetical protein